MIAPGFCRAAHSSMFKMQAPGSKGGVATAKQASDGTMKHISGFSLGRKQLTSAHPLVIRIPMRCMYHFVARGTLD